MAKKLMKGNEAIGEAAIRAGCLNYFAYPITPQSEVAEYLSRRLPEVGGTFLQGESEVAVSYMLFGAAAAGERVFSTSSSPGISLMSEGLSYIAGAQLPVVLVNIVRGGPGLGGILPAQSDYFQATKGGGHGDYHTISYAPSGVQEAVDLMVDAFPIAERYCNPVMLLGDGMIGQMMEPVEFPEPDSVEPPLPRPWATTGKKDREQNLIRSLFLNPDSLEYNNLHLKAKYDAVERDEVRYEAYKLDGKVDVLIAAYGTMARICKTAVDMLEGSGIKVGLIRPISVYPFPMDAVYEASQSAGEVLVVELSTGQMVEDVHHAVRGTRPIHFYGKTGGSIPPPDTIVEEVRKLAGKGKGGRGRKR
jgi:2-oxoglutarate ferredoxin oxidoreductase subunit alpha